MRPCGKARRKPGHLMITDGRAKGSWPKRDNIWVGVMSTLRACRARPSTGWTTQVRMALRGNPMITRRAVPSEGRGLRARVARPYSCQGISSREMGGKRPVA